MTLEWLRRHDPVLDRHLRTYLFTEGRHPRGRGGRRARRRRRRPTSGSARHRQPAQRQRGLPVNHLMRDKAPDHRRRLGRRSTTRRPASLTHFLAGRKLVDFSGPHGWEHSAVDLGRVAAAAPTARSTACAPPAPGAAARSSCARRSPSRAPSSTPPTAAPATSTSTRSSPRPGLAALAEDGVAVPRLRRRRASRASPSARPHDPVADHRRLLRLPAATWPRPWPSCGPPTSTAPTPSPSAPAATRA